MSLCRLDSASVLASRTRIEVNQKILLISRKWAPAVGGMETYAAELAASLQEAAEVRTFVLKGRRDGRPPSMVMYGIFLLRAAMLCLFLGRRFDRVIFGDLILFPAALCSFLVNRQARRITIVYGLDLAYQHRSGVLPNLYRLYFKAFRATQGIFGAVIAISRHTAALAEREGIHRVVVITPSLPPVNAQVETGEGLPDAWTQAGACRRILYFGRLVPRKGALWFARSVLPQLTSTASFFVVGDSSDEDYKKALRDCRHTHCLGRLASGELNALIRTADVVVMPNIPTPERLDVEGFGLVAIETTSLGGLLIASRLDGITDAVVDGVTGALVDSGDVARWVERIEDMFARDAAWIEQRRSSVSEATRRIYSRNAQAAAFLRALELDTRESYVSE